MGTPTAWTQRCVELLYSLVSQETAQRVAVLMANICQALATALHKSPVKLGPFIITPILQMGETEAQ